MKKSLLLLLIGVVACQSSQEKKETITELTDTAPSQITTEQTAAELEKTKQTPPARPDFAIGSVVYVLGKEDARPAPKKEDQPQTEDFALGTKLEIVGEEGPYYKVKKGAHESYVLKSEVGYKDESFSPEELEQVSYLTEYKGTTRTPKDLDNISEFFSISLISEADYQQALQQRPKPFDKGETIEKTGKILSLPCQKKKVKYEDISQDGFNEAIYSYVGEHKDIEQYIVRVTGAQVVPYILTDKATGNELYMDGFPLLSADRKHIITLHTDPVNDETDIALYRIEGTAPLRLKTMVKASLAWWRCAMNQQTPVFLGADQCLYAAIYPIGLPENTSKLRYIKTKIND
ncbi:hypothetical protein [Capnocytophaga granulosa]|uniref:hypothetical protein n=1 Tax=Capnocytophaga granulosa TaxID=45242 RepID=UPI003857497F